MQTYTEGFSERLLWERPAGVASVGFHLQHLRGVLDRLGTYARGESLTSEQRAALQAEGEANASLSELVGAFNEQVDRTLEQLRRTFRIMVIYHWLRSSLVVKKPEASGPRLFGLR